MRLRLGLLQDPAAIDRQIAREFAEAEAKRKKTAVPTVKNEADMKADLAKTAKEKDDVSKKVKAEHKPPRIRPLSESRAIETGANFISEGFLFLVAGGLILWETQRNRRKQEREHDARDDEIERIGHENATIKGEVEQLKQELAFVRGGSPKAEDETNAERGASPPNVTKISLSPELEKRIATSNESQKPA